MNRRFYHIVKSTTPVLVDFYADWCIPCRLMSPILKEIKERYKTKVRIIKVNVDNHPDIANTCQVQNIPAVVLFHDGKIRWSGIGVQQVNDISGALKEILSTVHQ
jgi:thioredoxin 1